MEGSLALCAKAASWKRWHGAAKRSVFHSEPDKLNRLKGDPWDRGWFEDTIEGEMGDLEAFVLAFFRRVSSFLRCTPFAMLQSPRRASHSRFGKVHF